MCVITDEKDIVVSVSLIPGIGHIPNGYHVYFPYNGNLPKEGKHFKPNEKEFGFSNTDTI